MDVWARTEGAGGRAVCRRWETAVSVGTWPGGQLRGRGRGRAGRGSGPDREPGRQCRRRLGYRGV